MTTELTGTVIETDITASEQILSIVERVETLQEEKTAVSDQIKDVFAEAKGNGLDVKALRKIIALRKKDRDERQEEEAILEVYKSAIGLD
jgi:uncharacterized protein (UPF0335 family)